MTTETVQKSVPRDSLGELEGEHGFVIAKHPNRLRFLREAVGMSQTDAAEALCMPTPTLNRHEQGNRSLDGFTIERYALFYGVTPYELFVSKQFGESDSTTV